MADLGINWGLGVAPAHSSDRIFESFEKGRQAKRQSDLERALGALGPGLNDPEALSTVYALSPQTGASIEDAAYQRAARQREDQSRRLTGDYLGASAAPAASPQERALQELARVNPEAAQALRSKEASVRLQQLETAEKVNEAGIQLLAGVSDQATYDAARTRYQQILSQFGLPPAALPEAYSPQVVQQLRMSTLTVKEQLEAMKPVVLADGGELYSPDGRTRLAVNEPDAKWLSVPAGGMVAQVGGGGAPRGAIPIGTIEDGYRFKGGHPADPNSWEPVGQGGAPQPGARTFP